MFIRQGKVREGGREGVRPAALAVTKQKLGWRLCNQMIDWKRARRSTSSRSSRQAGSHPTSPLELIHADKPSLRENLCRILELEVHLLPIIEFCFPIYIYIYIGQPPKGWSAMVGLQAAGQTSEIINHVTTLVHVCPLWCLVSHTSFAKGLNG